jgi:hypothetical protein
MRSAQSSSLPGLTRQSMMRFIKEKLSGRFSLWTLIMDARVKPAHDEE